MAWGARVTLIGLGLALVLANPGLTLSETAGASFRWAAESVPQPTVWSDAGNILITKAGTSDAQLTTGVTGNAIRQTGNNQYYKFPVGGMNLDKGVMRMYVKHATPSGPDGNIYRIFFRTTNAEGTPNAMFARTYNNSLQFNIYDSQGRVHRAFGQATWSADVWYLYEFIWDADTGEVTIRRDGVDLFQSSTPSWSAALPSFVGQDMFIGHVYPLGAFDEIYIGQQGDDPGPEDGMVIWENNFNSTPEWSSAQDYTGAVRDTHALAISQWNATSFRVSGQNVIPSGQHVLSVQSGVGRNGGKALVYAFYGRGDWMAASIDIDFADPDVIWRNVDRNGYDKIWLRYWYRTPVNLDFDTKAPGNTQTTVLWKVARAYAFNPELYYTGASDPDIYWGRFWAKNDSVSSHYLNLDAGQQYYKKPFMIPSINHVSGYWLPQWIRETDPDGGTSAYFNINDRRNLSTHWVSSLSDPANLNGGNNITGFLADGEWHLVEICLKLNDVGQENSIQEFYLDGSEFPVTTIGNDLGMRITPGMKFRQIVLFDNYLKNDKSTQYLYIDSIVISTERLPYNYEAQ